VRLMRTSTGVYTRNYYLPLIAPCVDGYVIIAGFAVLTPWIGRIIPEGSAFSFVAYAILYFGIVPMLMAEFPFFINDTGFGLDFRPVHVRRFRRKLEPYAFKIDVGRVIIATAYGFLLAYGYWGNPGGIILTVALFVWYVYVALVVYSSYLFYLYAGD
jgi:hypothetical protein